MGNDWRKDYRDKRRRDETPPDYATMANGVRPDGCTCRKVSEGRHSGGRWQPATWETVATCPRHGEAT